MIKVPSEILEAERVETVPMAWVAFQGSIEAACVMARNRFAWPHPLEQFDYSTKRDTPLENTIFAAMPQSMVTDALRYASKRLKVLGKLPDLKLEVWSEDGYPATDSLALSNYYAEHPVKTQFLTEEEFARLKPKSKRKTKKEASEEAPSEDS